MNIEHYSYTAGDLQVLTPLSAITGDTTSAAFDIFGAKAICIEFVENATVSNRSGVLTVTVSVDGTNYRAYNMLISNATNTSEQNLTRVASVTRNSAGADLIWMTPETLAFHSMKVSVDVTDGGTPTGSFTVNVTIFR